MYFLVFTIGLLITHDSVADLLSLTDIYKKALKQDPALQAQTALTEIQQAIVVQDRASKGISANATMSSKYTQNIKDDDTYRTGSLSATVSLPLYDKSLDSLIESREANARASTADLESYRQEHLLAVAKIYFAVLSAQQDLIAAKAEITAFERQLEQASERLVVGIGTRVDVDQARARLDLSQVGLISSEVVLETAKLDLQKIINESVSELAELVANFDAVIHRDFPNNLSQFVNDHPDVKSKQESLRSALAVLDEAAAENQPTISVSSKFSLSDSGGSSVDSTNASTLNNLISLTLALPLYTNGKNEAAVMAAEASVRAAESSLRAEERHVRSKIRVAYRNLEASVRTVKARKLAIVSAESRVEATEAAYSVGSGDIVGVLNSKKDLFAAERDYAKARHTHVIRQFELDEAIGDLSNTSLTRVEQELQ